MPLFDAHTKVVSLLDDLKTDKTVYDEHFSSTLSEIYNFSKHVYLQQERILRLLKHFGKRVLVSDLEKGSMNVYLKLILFNVVII